MITFEETPDDVLCNDPSIRVGSVLELLRRIGNGKGVWDGREERQFISLSVEHIGLASLPDGRYSMICTGFDVRRSEKGAVR